MPLVGVVMGSRSDEAMVQETVNVLRQLGVEHEVVVDYALRMKREFAGERLWINAYTNKVSTYIASKRLIAEGGYEVNNSLSAKLSPGQPHAVTPAVEDRIVDAVGEILPPTFK